MEVIIQIITKAGELFTKAYIWLLEKIMDLIQYLN